MSRPRGSHPESRAGLRPGRRRRAQRPHRPPIAIEILEGRTLLSITDLTFAAFPAAEGVPVAQFQGGTGTDLLATFTDTNPGLGPTSFSAAVLWGDGGTDIDLGRGGGILILPDTDVANQWDVYDLPGSYSPAGGHAYQEEGLYNLSLTVKDLSDGGLAVASESLIVHDAPLTAAGVGSIAPAEGVPFTGTLATFTDADPGGVLGEYAATVDWGDGATSTATITQPRGVGTPFVVSGTHTYAEEGAYPGAPGLGPVVVTIVDNDGHNPPQGTRAVVTVTDSAAVGDAPLTPLPLTVPFAGVEGIAVSGVVATFADANPAASPADFSGTIDWGDGTTSSFTSASVQLASRSATQAIFNVFATHMYAEEGTDRLSVAIRDAGGSGTTGVSTAQVGDAPLSATAASIVATQALPFTGTVATFSDTNPAAPASDFSGTIDWGDGTTSAFTSADVSLVARTTTLAQFAVAGSHVYAADGIYSTVRVTIRDRGGSTASAVDTATVADAPITAAPAIVPPGPTEGNPFTAAVATFTTPNARAVPAGFSAMIDWGDGSPPTTGVVTQPGGAGTVFVISGTHTYAEESSPGRPYNVIVAVADIAGSPDVPASTAITVAQVTAADAPLTGSMAAIAAQTGIPIFGAVGSFTDGNPAAAIGDYPDGSATIDWGDGTTSAGTVTLPVGAGTAFGIVGSHIYLRPGDFPVSATIHDRGGSTLVLNGTAHVSVSPLLGTGLDATGVEGAALTTTVATFLNGNPFFPPGNPPGSAYSAIIEWGDGFSSSATIQPDPAQPGVFDVSGTHTYAEDGVYATRVAITDTQGATTAGPVTGTVTVQDAPLSGTSIAFQPTEGLPFSGAVASFTDADPGGRVDDYAAKIDWGDGPPGQPDVAVGTISQPGGPGTPFIVSGTHTYAQEGRYSPIRVTITDDDHGLVPPPSSPPPVPHSGVTIASVAFVKDAPLTPTPDPYPITAVEGSALADTFPREYPGAGAVVGTFMDTNPLPYQGRDASDFSATILWSPGVITQGTIVPDPATPGQFDVLGGHTYAAAGLYPIQVFLGDVGGSTAVAASVATVTDAPLSSSPTGSAGAPLISFEGAFFSGPVAHFLDSDPRGVPADYSATIAWGDGTTSAGTIQADPAGGFDAIGTHDYAEDGDYTIASTITAVDVPASIAPSTTSTASAIRVYDEPLTASAAAPPSLVEGAASPRPITMATFTDADPNGHVGDYIVTIAWGDGTTSAGAVAATATPGVFAVQGSHAYTEDGSWTATVTIVDGDPDRPPPMPTDIPRSVAAVDVPMMVLDAPLTAQLPPATAGQVEGQAFTDLPVAMFSDTDPGGQPGDYTVTIDWGDGSSPSIGKVVQVGPGATFQVLGSHTYAEESPGGHPYAVVIQVADTDLAPGPPPTVPRSSTAIVNAIPVRDAPLSLAAATIPVQVEGKAASIAVATLTDADPRGDPGDYSGTIAWGDNTSTTLSAANFVAVPDSPGRFTIVATHTYVEEGSFAPIVQVFDTDGGARATTDPSTVSAIATAAVSVADAPLMALGAPLPITSTPSGSSIVEGSPTGDVAVAVLQDANPYSSAADYAVTIAWGDGATSAGMAEPGLYPGLFTIFGNQTYKEEGTYNPVTVTIVDRGGARAVAGTTSIVVADAPLSASTDPVTIPALAGAPLGDRVVAMFTDTDPGAVPGDFAITIDWGDGSSSSPTSIGVLAGTTFDVLGNHIYAYNGTYAVSVRVDDTDGASTVHSSTVALNTTVIVAKDPPGSQALGLGSPLVAMGGSLSATEGSAFAGTIGTFNNDVASLPSDYTATIDWGDGATSAGVIGYDPAQAAFTVAGAHTYARAGSYPATMTIGDQGGSSAQSAISAIVADAPLSAIGLGLSTSEGSAWGGVVATFTDADPAAAAADYTATIAWGDGATSAGVVAYDPARAAFTVAASHTYSRAGGYSPIATISDYGGATARASGGATVADAPLSTIALAWTTTEGSPWSGVVATFTDADPGASATDYASTIAWGDGATSAGVVAYDPARAAFTIAGAHTYARAGSYTAAVTVGDYGGAMTQANAAATVDDAPLSASGPTLSATEGLPWGGVVATFTDADPGAVAAGYTATIAWGDGATSAGVIAYDPARAAFVVSGAHTYSRAGAYVPVVRVADSGGSIAQSSGEATVADAPLSTIALAVTTSEGSRWSGVVATFTDADPGAAAADYSATIAWGDGMTSAGSVAYDPARAAFVVAGAHTYARAGAYSPIVSLSDHGGATARASGGATVADAPLSASGRALSMTEGSAWSGVVATFTDANPAAAAADYTATIAWGDGATSAGVIAYDPARATFTVAASHTYSQAGSYTARIRILDEMGRSAQVSDPVGAVPPPSMGQASNNSTAMPSPALPIFALQGLDLTTKRPHSFRGILASFTDDLPSAVAADFTATISWGDGRSSPARLNQPGGPGHPLLVRGVHFYPRRQQFTIRITISAGDGSIVASTQSTLRLSWRDRGGSLKGLVHARSRPGRSRPFFRQSGPRFGP